MKKWRLLILLMGLALFAPGCGFDDGGEDSTVVVIKATPTPEPTPTPVATPTPEVTPTPAPVYEQTASGVNIEKKEGTYYATADVNLRVDCSTEVDYIQGVAAGTELKGTGVSEDGAWIQVDFNGQVCYVTAEYMSTTPPAGDAAAAGTEAAGTEAAAQ